MRVFWQIVFVVIGVHYVANALGVLFDGWQLTVGQVGFACFATALWAIHGFIAESDPDA